MTPVPAAMNIVAFHSDSGLLLSPTMVSDVLALAFEPYCCYMTNILPCNIAFPELTKVLN
jgi:hypothetical protein